MRNPAWGLAEAMGLDPEIKTVRATGWWRVLPAGLWPAPLRDLDLAGDRPVPAWPDLAISCGRRAVAAALAIGRAAGGATRCVHVTHPRVALSRFDVVVLPEHDGVSGPNVVPVRGSVGRVTRARIAAAGAALADDLAALPRPRVAVLIGGSNRRYVLDRTVAARLGDDLARLAEAAGASLLVTPSRRTGAANMEVLRERLAGVPARIWDGAGDNPYLGFLGQADAVVVTCDSVNMISEACITGHPVLLAALGGRGTAKFDRFHRTLVDAGHARWFRGQLERWDVRPLDETPRAARAVLEKLGWG